MRNEKWDSDISLEKLIADIDAEVGPVTPPVPDVSGSESDTAFTHKRYIAFFLDEIFLAVLLSNALEIGREPAITPLPNLPEWVLGVSNIRGEIISIIDLKAFMGLPAHGFKKIRRFIVIHHKDIKVGIVVDRITGIFSPARSEDKDCPLSSPYNETGEISAFISGIVAPGEHLSNISGESRVLNILNVEKLLSSTRMTAFRNEK